MEKYSNNTEVQLLFNDKQLIWSLKVSKHAFNFQKQNIVISEQVSLRILDHYEIQKEYY